MGNDKIVSYIRWMITLCLAFTALAGCTVVNAVDGHNRRVRRQDEMMQKELDVDEDSYRKCVITEVSNQSLSKKETNEIADLAINSCDAERYKRDYISATYRYFRLASESEPTDATAQANSATKEMIVRTRSAAIRAIGEFRTEFAEKTAKMRASTDPWEKYLLFSELSAGTVEPLDADEISRVAREAFEEFGECAKQTDPSCMDMYGELILRGASSLNAIGKVEARRKAFYWLSLAARYGYEPARKALVSEGENIPSPDLAMEKLQRDANNIAVNSQLSAERVAREKAARDYELIRETRRQTEQIIWSNLFPKIVNCTSSAIGSNVYTNCQ